MEYVVSKQAVLLGGTTALKRTDQRESYTVERTFLANFSAAECAGRIIRAHMGTAFAGHENPGKQPIGKKSAERQPAGKKPAGKKSAEQQPAGKQPAGSMP